MKLVTTLNLNNQINQCQFGIEVELDDDADMDKIQTKTNKAMAALKTAINSVVNIKALNNAPSTSPKPKQLPSDSASQGQRKFLKDLTSKCGITLNQWCKDHGVAPEDITASHCKEWIPELKERSQDLPF